MTKKNRLPFQKFRLLVTPVILMGCYALAASHRCWWGWLLAIAMIPPLAVATSIVMHDVGHGLISNKWLRHLLLSLLGVAHMLSGHAFWATHSQHHRRFPTSQEEDPEGHPTGLLFVARLWVWAWRNKPKARIWLTAEALGAGAVLMLGWIWWRWMASPVLLVYVGLTIPASWAGYAVIAWVSHQARILAWPRKQVTDGTFLGEVLVFFFGVIILHEEHHTHPSVPSYELKQYHWR